MKTAADKTKNRQDAKASDSKVETPSLPTIRFNSPLLQVGLLGFVFFSLPGMFSALNGLGGGGKSDPTINDDANTAVAVTFAVSSLLAGGIFNLVGPQLMLLTGGLTYALYVSSYVVYKAPFVITAGGILGVGAGLLWAAQGAIMLSYPDEDQKGKYFGLFWSIFSCGATMGSLIALIIEWSSSGQSSVSTTTYFVFISIMVIGSILALVMLPPRKVFRDNREPVSMYKYSSWKTEVVEILKLFKDWRMLALTPMFLASNWYYTYEFNCVNGGGYFTTRTRAMNGLAYFISQIIGSNLMGNLMDSTRLSKNRRTRALLGLTVIFFTSNAIWGGALRFQLTFTRATLMELQESQRVDLMNINRYLGPGSLFALFGLFDAMWATYVYWIMGALTNDTQTAARFAGFFKCIQNVGVALAGQVDARKVSYFVQLLINWGLLTVGALSAYLVAMSVTQTSWENVGKEAPESCRGSSVSSKRQRVMKKSLSSIAEEATGICEGTVDSPSVRSEAAKSKTEKS